MFSAYAKVSYIKTIVKIRSKQIKIRTIEETNETRKTREREKIKTKKTYIDVFGEYGMEGMSPSSWLSSLSLLLLHTCNSFRYVCTTGLSARHPTSNCAARACFRSRVPFTDR